MSIEICHQDIVDGKGFSSFERTILNRFYDNEGLSDATVSEKLTFWSTYGPDGESAVHYHGMGHDDEETQDKISLNMREYMYLYQANLLDEPKIDNGN
jgi:hypothetical protein